MWQRGESAKGYSCEPDDPELKLRHQELTEEIEHWETVVKDAEAKGFHVSSESLTVPHIHNGIGQDAVRATDNRRDGSTWTAAYDDVSGRMSADGMRQKALDAA
ncbi:hypothetical protein [Streptomyces sp. MBT62]|uniref:hypothetical protein n=1 Tax=Streptomyces sp. MBT62 TaxID=2800410 RepID=UPI00190AE559|nr:hypothetical protein [Streptomyces sp. MBT62]MBK3570932.1 hypothetical protein [Streptomyces sp. MBT62]